MAHQAHFRTSIVPLCDKYSNFLYLLSLFKLQPPVCPQLEWHCQIQTNCTRIDLIWPPAYLESNRNSIPHTLETQSYRKPTFCDFCGEFLFGLTKQGVRCNTCGLNFHKKCAYEKLNICNGKMASESPVKNHCQSAERNKSNGQTMASDPFESLRLVLNSLNPQESLAKCQQEAKSKELSQSTNGVLMPHSFQVHTYKLPTKCQYCDSLLFGIIRQGLQCKDCKFNVHKRCEDKVPNNCTGEAPKELIESPSESHTLVESLNNSGHLQDGQNAINNNHIQAQNEDSSVFETPNIPLMRIAQSIRRGNRFTTTGSSSANDPHESTQETNGCPTAKMNDESTKNGLKINEEYEFFPDETLGSGQFGVVYAGRDRISRRSVAIKIIDKHRFPPEQASHLKNEESILKTISNPGIVKLENVFETPHNIFVIMEKLNGDLLDMIVNYRNPLNGEVGRLSERITKFLIYQILMALGYLHKKNIVHCDLKPENVLLTRSSEYPQVKLCDFGFARIIGETSFRRSIVGTPAYLAPEVLKNKGYNRSLDMWSVGVIIYVSLSGVFPFNEGEDINDQIENASFMYPCIPWSSITSEAKNLIQNLLQVTPRLRFTVDQSLIHPWLHDYTTWCDLRQLEHSLNCRWLTHESDDKRWAEYSMMHNLQPPEIPEPFGRFSTRDAHRL